MEKKATEYLNQNDADQKYFDQISAKSNTNDIAQVLCDFQLNEIANTCSRCPVEKYCSVGRSGFLSFVEE